MSGEGKIPQRNGSGLPAHVIMPTVLPELHVDDVLRMRKPHPCGGYDWKVYRLGADIGMECLKCGRRVFLPRRALARRLKKVLAKEEYVQDSP